MCVLERESDSKRSKGEDEACDGGGGSGGKKRERDHIKTLRL